MTVYTVYKVYKTIKTLENKGLSCKRFCNGSIWNGLQKQKNLKNISKTFQKLIDFLIFMC